MQGERQCVSFPRSCSPLQSLLKRPRGQQSVFDQAPGVLPVRRETIEGIDCCRMLCVHPAGAQCGTRCKVETCRGGHCMQRHASQALRRSGLLGAGHLEDPLSCERVGGWAQKRGVGPSSMTLRGLKQKTATRPKIQSRLKHMGKGNPKR